MTKIASGRLSFDVSAETLRSTGLGALKPGEKVNIETSLRADGKLGGHFVTGHVDAVGSIRSIEKSGETWSICSRTISAISVSILSGQANEKV